MASEFRLDPVAAHLLHHHVGHDVAGVERGVACAGPRVERLDQRLGIAQRIVVAAERLLDPGEIARGQLLEVAVYDGAREVDGRRRLGRGEGSELQFEAFGRLAGADPGRIEVLHMAQRDGEFLEQLLGVDVGVLGQHPGQLLEALGEVAVVVEGFDEEGDKRALAAGELGEGELGQQVVAQAGRRGLNFAAIDVLVVVA